jgi:hypothetical protein
MISIDRRNEALRRKNTRLLDTLLGGDIKALGKVLFSSPSRHRPLRFIHGLGDCVNAATLWFALSQLKGMKFTVDCPSQFAPIFKAAGVTVSSGASEVHPWEHPPYTGSIHPVWVDNKTAFNCPVPMTQELWDAVSSAELRLCFPKHEQVISEWIAKLKRPITVLHTRGATSGVYKDFPAKLEKEFFAAFEKQLPGTLVWLSGNPGSFERIVQFPHRGLGYLYSLLNAANLVIGIDSGPLHLTRWTETPGIGCWFSLNPTAFAIPCKRIRHLATREPLHKNEYGTHSRYLAALPSRTTAFNLMPVSTLTAEIIANETANVIGHK